MFQCLHIDQLLVFTELAEATASQLSSTILKIDMPTGSVFMWEWIDTTHMWCLDLGPYL